MQSESSCSTDNSNVINLFTGKSVAEQYRQSIVQMCPETTGIRMLYASPSNPERLIAVPILCWGLRVDGEVVGMVPWINEVIDCTSVDEHLDVSWEGYYFEETDSIFFDAPPVIVAQLATAMRFNPTPLFEIQTLELKTFGVKETVLKENDVKNTYSTNIANTDLLVNDKPEFAAFATIENIDNTDGANHTRAELEVEDVLVIQEIPDLIGTHALLVNEETQSLMLMPVISWALDEQGALHGMLVDEDTVEKTPVIPGDDCLYVATSNVNFRCYFQRDIAEQIRSRNPDTLAAIEKLLAS